MSVNQIDLPTSHAVVGESKIFLARIKNILTETLLPPEDVRQIFYNVYPLSTIQKRRLAPVPSHQNVAVTISETLFDSCQTNANLWTEDATGYNFLHIPDNTQSPLFPQPGYYEVCYTFRLKTSSPLTLTFPVTVE